MKWMTKLALLVALGLGSQAMGQVYDFYPRTSGGSPDGISWENPDNWYRYLVDNESGDHYLYPPTLAEGGYGLTPYDRPMTGGAEAYIRNACTVTIGSGVSGTANEVDIGSPSYQTAGSGGTWLPRAASTLTIKNGGTLNCITGVNIGNAYNGTMIMETGSLLKNVRLYLGRTSDTNPFGSATGTFLQYGGTQSSGKSQWGQGLGGVGIYKQYGGYATFVFNQMGYLGDQALAGHGYYTLYDGTVQLRAFYLGSTRAGTVAEESWGELNFQGGTLRMGGGNFGQGGIESTHGRVTMGKGFHCDVTTVQAPDGDYKFDDAHFWQYAGGELVVEVKNSSEFGYMSVAQGITLDGTFSAVVAPGATWNVGATFEVLKSRISSITATQAFLDSYNTVVDRYFNISIDSDGLILTAIKAAGALPHAGDANNDGAVNVGDLGILAANWNGTGKVWATGDFTGEGTVNVGDLGVLAANWGWTGAPAGPGIPEPASLAFLALGGLAMLRRRK